MRKCNIIGAALNIGQNKKGTELAPSWLRVIGLLDSLKNKYSHIRDLGDISCPEEYLKEASQLDFNQKALILSEYTQKLQDEIYKCLDSESTCFILGGDHSIALSTLAASLNYDENVKIIWVDAHPDINTPKTSPSFNLHGMPVAFALNLETNHHYQTLFSFNNFLNPKNIVYIGLRDIDRGELEYLQTLDIKFYTAEDVSKIGIQKVITETKEYLDPECTSNFHLSFDVDAIDPIDIPSTGTPVVNGLSLSDGSYILQSIINTNRLLTLDLVEVNPSLGSPIQLEKTKTSLLELFNFTNEHINLNYQSSSIERINDYLSSHE